MGSFFKVGLTNEIGMSFVNPLKEVERRLFFLIQHILSLYNAVTSIKDDKN
jgi:hypothetical protein